MSLPEQTRPTYNPIQERLGVLAKVSAITILYAEDADIQLRSDNDGNTVFQPLYMAMLLIGGLS